MLERSEYMPLQFLVKQKWSGSYQGMRFLMQKKSVPVNTEEDSGAEDSQEPKEPEYTNVLETVYWKEPFSYEATPDEEKTSMQFPLTEEGRLQAIEWLEQEYEAKKDEWTAAMKWNWER